MEFDFRMFKSFENQLITEWRNPELALLDAEDDLYIGDCWFSNNGGFGSTETGVLGGRENKHYQVVLQLF